MKRPYPRPRQQRVFLGCEGESEASYGAFLQHLCREAQSHIHIVAKTLHPAGNPLLLAQNAVKTCERERQKHGSFKHKVIMLDADGLIARPDLELQVVDLLRREGFLAIWQWPDHEGLLLRHFPGRDRNSPPAGQSLAALNSVWPTYRKNMAARAIRQVLSLDDVRRAAGVVPELGALLRRIGLL